MTFLSRHVFKDMVINSFNCSYCHSEFNLDLNISHINKYCDNEECCDLFTTLYNISTYIKKVSDVREWIQFILYEKYIQKINVNTNTPDIPMDTFRH
jgi:hypothetical protein